MLFSAPVSDLLVTVYWSQLMAGRKQTFYFLMKAAEGQVNAVPSLLAATNSHCSKWPEEENIKILHQNKIKQQKQTRKHTNKYSMDSKLPVQPLTIDL